MAALFRSWESAARPPVPNEMPAGGPGWPRVIHVRPTHGPRAQAAMFPLLLGLFKRTNVRYTYLIG